MDSDVELPRQLVLETVSVCNLRCPACAIGMRATRRSREDPKFMSWELFESLLFEVRSCVKHVYLHLWGEPTLHPRLGDMIRACKQEGMTVDVATHGLFVTKEMAAELALADTLSVSIDGITQETYAKYRVGGKVEDAMRGLRLLAEAAGPDRVGWTWVAWAWNEHEIPQARQIAEELKVKFGAKSPGLFREIPGALGAEDLPKDLSLLRYRTGEDGEAVLLFEKKGCREFWETVYVLPDGDVVTCCYDWNADWVVGNVGRDGGLLSVWNGPGYRGMREKHTGGELNQLCATQCKQPA